MEETIRELTARAKSSEAVHLLYNVGKDEETPEISKRLCDVLSYFLDRYSGLTTTELATSAEASSLLVFLRSTLPLLVEILLRRRTSRYALLLSLCMLSRKEFIITVDKRTPNFTMNTSQTHKYPK